MQALQAIRQKRLFSSETASIASSFLSRFQSRPQTRIQTLDANQLHLLNLTLNRPSGPGPGPGPPGSVPTPPAAGTPVPPGHHLVYFTPAFTEPSLGPDGTDTSYNPSAPFTRRMWAGGEVRWPRQNGRVNPLRVGQEVTETTNVVSAEPKVVRKTGEEMIVVGVEKVFGNQDGVAVIDRRYLHCPLSLVCFPCIGWVCVFVLTVLCIGIGSFGKLSHSRVRILQLREMLLALALQVHLV